MITTDFAIVHRLAEELSAAFERRTRNNGDEFVCLKDEHQDSWMRDVIHKAHGDKLPDDHIYQFCEMAADAMAEAEPDEDSMREALDEIEPPVYTHQQMKWFASNWEYCDQAIEEGLWESASFGPAHTGLQHRATQTYNQVTDLVAIGMQLHIREVGGALLDALIERADEIAE